MPDNDLAAILDGYIASVATTCQVAVRCDRGGVLIERMRSRVQRAGVGTIVLVRLLALADEHEHPVRLYADPSLEPDEPDLETLVRWYARHGFAPTGITPDGWIRMERPVRGGANPDPVGHRNMDHWIADLQEVEEE